MVPYELSVAHVPWFQFGASIVLGSSVNTNMLIYKVCRYELGYNDTVCDNLETEEEFEDAENEGKSSLSAQNDTK